MRKRTLLMTLLFALLLFPVSGMANPKAVVDTPVYEFGAVPEGPLVNAEFVIKNKGTDVLILEKVSPP